MPAFLRIASGLAVFFAIAWQLKIHVDASYDVVNFFSYFTNLSNLFAAAVLIVAALRLFHGAGIDLLRGTAVVAMALVGLVFGALLRNVDLGSLLPWINTLLHYVMPCVLVIDWLLDPPRTALRARHLAIALAFPIVYLIYVLVRGSLVAWYPYPFLNPAHVGGYGGVVAYAAAIAVAFVAVGWLLFGVGNRLRGRRAMFAD